MYFHLVNLDMAEESKFIEDQLLRFRIYECYIDTDFYLNFLNSCNNVVSSINKEIQTVRPFASQRNKEDLEVTIEICDQKMPSAVSQLNDRTGIPHRFHFDDKKREYYITEPELHFDYLPLIIRKYSPDPPKMLTLRFDLERGLNEQLKGAESKLKDAQKDMKMSEGHGLFEDVKTTRKTMDSITNAIQMVANRDQLKRTKKLNWDDTASALNLKLETARNRYKTGMKLILSGEIRKYFPEFH